GFALHDRLSHLERHRARELGLAAPQDLRGLADLLGPRLVWYVLPLEKRGVAPGQDAIELAGRGLGEGLEDFSGRRIDRLQAHGVVPLTSMLSPDRPTRNETSPAAERITSVGGPGSRRRRARGDASRASRPRPRGARPAWSDA